VNRPFDAALEPADENWFAQYLTERLRARALEGGLRHSATAAHPRPSYCTNDYLGFAAEQWQLVEPNTAAADSDEALGTCADAGAGASRLVAGERPAHQQLDHAIGAWLGYAGVLTFASGYACNVGTLEALIDKRDIVYSDALNHASLIDGMRLSRATARVFPHNDLDALEALLAAEVLPNVASNVDSVHKVHRSARVWVVVESYYSMDANSPDLERLRALCNRFGAGMIVDEAHALGLFGPSGRGLCAAAGVVPDVLLGTLGKSLGSQGAFAAGSAVLREYLWNFARSFVFSTGLSPLAAAVAARNVPRVQAAEAERAHVHALGERLRNAVMESERALGVRGAPVGRAGPVVPWVLGDARVAVRAEALLRAHGVEARAIRYPTVPEGAARIRLVMTAAHSLNDCEAVCTAVRNVTGTLQLESDSERG
jgi:8-amino-7-oxononanoate synthase